MTFTNVLEKLSIAGMHNRQWDSTVFNDVEEPGNWGNQIESKQPFLFYSDILSRLRDPGWKSHPVVKPGYWSCPGTGIARCQRKKKNCLHFSVTRMGSRGTLVLCTASNPCL